MNVEGMGLHDMKPMVFRRARAALLVGACALSLAGCSGMPALPELPFPNPLAKIFDTTSVAEAQAQLEGTKTAALSVPDVVSEGVLTVGLRTDQASAPTCIVGEGGALSGIDIDLASIIADELGLKVRFVTVSGVSQPLADGVCDMVMDASAEDAGPAVIVGGYYETASAFFHKGDATVVSVDQLNGKTVGLQEGSVSQGVLSRTGLSMTQRTYTNLNEAFDGLNAGSVDYVLCDAYPGAYLAAAYQNINFAGALNAPTSLGIAVSPDKAKTQEAIRQALDRAQVNGLMDIVRARWIGGMPALTVTDEISNVPGSTVATDARSSEAETTGEATQDGSTAGANAVASL